MEYRYYITTTIVVIFLQLLLYSFSKTLGWLFNLSTKYRRTVTATAFLLINGLVILHVTHILPIFRIMAFVLVLLLFAFFVSANPINPKKAKG